MPSNMNNLNLLDSDKLRRTLLLHTLYSEDDEFDPAFAEKITEILESREPSFADYEVQASLMAFKSELPQKGGARQERRVRSHRRIRLRTLAAAILLFVLVSGTILTSAEGIDVWARVVSWGREILQIGDSATIAGKEENVASPTDSAQIAQPSTGEYHSLEEAAFALGVEIETFGWIPDGFELVNINTIELSSLKSISARYVSGEREFFYNIQFNPDGSTTDFFEISEGGETKIINGREYYLTSNNELRVATWLNSEAVFSISGQLAAKDLVKMLESIK